MRGGGNVKIPKKVAWAGQVITFKDEKEAEEWLAGFVALSFRGATTQDAIAVLEYFDEKERKKEG